MNKMKIHVLSRIEIENVLNRTTAFAYDNNRKSIDDFNIENIDDTFIISILDSSGPYGIPLFKEDHNNVMTLTFDDVLKSGDSSPTVSGNTIAFNIIMAENLYNFIELNKDKNTCLVHCAAGISRSGGVGTFIHDLFGIGNYFQFQQNNPRIFPNPHVLKLLRAQHNNKILNK